MGRWRAQFCVHPNTVQKIIGFPYLTIVPIFPKIGLAYGSRIRCNTQPLVWEFSEMHLIQGGHANVSSFQSPLAGDPVDQGTARENLDAHLEQ